MRKRVIVVAMVIAAGVAGLPSRAAAAGLDDIWDIVDALSGPGPFKGGPVMAATIPCWQDGTVTLTRAVSNPRKTDPCLYVDFRDLYVDPKGPYARVSAKFVETGLTFEQHPALAVGAGVGVAFFSTTVDNRNYNVTNFIATPVRIVVKPLRLWLDDPRFGAVQVHMRLTVRFGDIEAADFGAPNHPWSAGTETLRGVGLVFDLLQALKR
jgi:hypothetical protein